MRYAVQKCPLGRINQQQAGSSRGTDPLSRHRNLVEVRKLVDLLGMKPLTQIDYGAGLNGVTPPKANGQLSPLDPFVAAVDRYLKETEDPGPSSELFNWLKANDPVTHGNGG